MPALIGPAQVQARQHLRTERDKWMWGSIYNEEIYQQRKTISLFQRNGVEYINYTSGKGSCPGGVGLHKQVPCFGLSFVSFLFLFVLAFFFAFSFVGLFNVCFCKVLGEHGGR